MSWVQGLDREPFHSGARTLPGLYVARCRLWVFPICFLFYTCVIVDLRNVISRCLKSTVPISLSQFKVCIYPSTDQCPGSLLALPILSRTHRMVTCVNLTAQISDYAFQHPNEEWKSEAKIFSSLNSLLRIFEVGNQLCRFQILTVTLTHPSSHTDHCRQNVADTAAATRAGESQAHNCNIFNVRPAIYYYSVITFWVM